MKLLDEFYEFESSYVNWKDRGEEYAQMREKMREYVSQLMPNLTKEQREIIGNMRLLYGRMECEAEKAAYKEGFKMGLARAASHIKLIF